MHPVHEDVRESNNGNAYSAKPEDVPEKDADQHPGQETGKHRPAKVNSSAGIFSLRDSFSFNQLCPS